MLRSPGYSIKEILSRPFGYPNINRLYGHMPDVAFFDYVSWNKVNMLSNLKDAGIDTAVFRNPHSDCILSPIIDHLIRAAWTVGKKEVYISNQIRAGLLTIDEGEKLIAEAQSQKLDPTILTEIGFSDNEITQIFGESAVS
jgi:hypothetical protein